MSNQNSSTNIKNIEVGKFYFIHDDSKTQRGQQTLIVKIKGILNGLLSKNKTPLSGAIVWARSACVTLIIYTKCILLSIRNKKQPMNPLGVNAYRLLKLFNQTIETLSITY